MYSNANVAHVAAKIHCSAEVDTGVHLGAGVVVGAHTRIIAGRDRPTTISNGVEIGPGATITGGTQVGTEACIKANSIVQDDVPALAIVGGSPARVVSYRHTCNTSEANSENVFRLGEVVQERGRLMVLERGPNLPFEPRRFLTIYGVPQGGHRGDHAHKTLEEVVVCVKGSCKVLLDNGSGRRELIQLERPNVGVRIRPRIWTAQYDHSPDAVVVVIASSEYDPEDYISRYEEFLQFARTP